MKVEYIRINAMQTQAFVEDKMVATIDKHTLGYEVWFNDGNGTIGYPTMKECKAEIERVYSDREQV